MINKIVPNVISYLLIINHGTVTHEESISAQQCLFHRHVGPVFQLLKAAFSRQAIFQAYAATTVDLGSHRRNLV